MTQNVTVKTHSVHIFNNINRAKSYEQDCFNKCLNFIVRFKNFALLYNTVGAGAAGMYG
jgi:hypothetical protein